MEDKIGLNDVRIVDIYTHKWMNNGQDCHIVWKNDRLYCEKCKENVKSVKEYLEKKPITIARTTIEATTDPKLKGMEGEKHARYHLL